MNSNSASALNFSYLLLDFYKTLNINEQELVVILMIDHLRKQENEFITKDELLLKMNLSEKEIDQAMTSLYKKKYIEFSFDLGKPSTSIKPIKKILYKKFEQSIFTEEEIANKKETLQKRETVFDFLEKTFGRQLTPIEISRADEWINNDVEEDIIINSIKDSALSNRLSITYIDRLIIKKMKKEDNSGNAIK
ncbi:MAG: DnaD domain protein [Erysipelotrichaceae bacterium]|jgi:DNA replication protein|nr:DnaD domain protein [Erysipelotrichaceae bacterium]MCB9499967.1 DnaD domain protein [Erysipelotrichaceae bacterium]